MLLSKKRQLSLIPSSCFVWYRVQINAVWILFATYGRFTLLLVCPFYSDTTVRQHCWASVACGSYAMRVQPSTTDCHISIELQLKKINPEALTKTWSNRAVPLLRSNTPMSAPSVNRYLRGPCWYSRSSNISSWTSALSCIPEATENIVAICFHVCRFVNKWRGPSPFSNDDSCVTFIAIEFASADENIYPGLSIRAYLNQGNVDISLHGHDPQTSVGRNATCVCCDSKFTCFELCQALC